MKLMQVSSKILLNIYRSIAEEGIAKINDATLLQSASFYFIY